MIRKKRYNNFLIGILIIVILCISGSGYAKSDSPYVVDDANILSDNVMEYMDQVNLELKEKLDSSISVRALSTLENKKIEDVANELYRDIYIDPNENDVLILLAPNENKSYIKIGPGLVELFPDEVRRKLQYEEMVKNFDQGLFDTAAVKGFNSVLNPLLNREGISLDVEFNLDEEPPSQGSSLTWKVIVVIIGLIVVDLLVFDAQFINTVSRAVVGFRGEYKGNMSPYRTSERFRGAGTGPRDDWPSDLEKENKYGNW